jgi:hypothetical protein
MVSTIKARGNCLLPPRIRREFTEFMPRETVPELEFGYSAPKGWEYRAPRVPWTDSARVVIYHQQ